MDKRKEMYVVYSDVQVKEALTLIEENAHRSLIVLSREGIVVGTLSDGDVRKALLGGRRLEIPVSEIMNTNFISAVQTNKAEATELFKKKRIFLIPVIDEQSRLIDIIEAYPGTP